MDGDTCNGPRYLSVEDLTELNATLIREQTPDEPIGVLKPNELASAQQRPSNHRYYKQTEDMAVLAAVLLESLAKNHCFENANKRTAFAAAAIFLEINGWELTAPEGEVIEMTVGIVTHVFTVDECTDWIRYWCRPSNASELNDCE